MKSNVAWYQYVASFGRKLLIAGLYLSVFAVCFYAPRVYRWLTQRESLNVFVLPGRISSDVIAAFERQYGVRVCVQFFENDEELYAKFAITKGEGHDVVLGSDYMVQTLANKGLLARLDHTLLPHRGQLDSRLLGHAYDAEQSYCMPFSWLTYGIMCKRSLLKNLEASHGLELVFQEPERLYRRGVVTQPFNVCLLDEHREMIALAALYLFGRVVDLGSNEFAKIQQLLIQQKNWASAYTTSSLPYFLLSDVVPVALCPSNYAVRILQQDSSYLFIVPSQGSLMVIENLAIAAACRQQKRAHEFINFLLSEESARQHAEQFSHFVSHALVYGQQEERLRSYGDLAPSAELFSRLSIMSQQIDVRIIEQLWLSLHAA